MVIYIALAAFLSTLFGGLFALRFKDKLHLIVGFSAGAIIGVAFFDLLPESLELGSIFEASTILAIAVVGFACYMILDRFVVAHHHSDDHDTSCKRGLLGAGSLSIHSFLDGAAIGLAFQVSSSVGAIVAIAVLVHDFSDGINTVNMILKNKGDKKRALRWLMIDALAPVFGVIVGSFYTLSETSLAVLLAVFAGFFLYIGASDLLPESHHEHPTVWTTVATLLGIGVLFLAITLAGV
jgi:zinc transporter ZupT